MTRNSASRAAYGEGARVVYAPPGQPARFGVVPAERRCRGCRGFATLRYFASGQRRRSQQTGEVSRGLLVCVDCLVLWRWHGRTGKTFRIAEAT